jgi:hypothetical protein
MIAWVSAGLRPSLSIAACQSPAASWALASWALASWALASWALASWALVLARALG